MEIEVKLCDHNLTASCFAYHSPPGNIQLYLLDNLLVIATLHVIDFSLCKVILVGDNMFVYFYMVCENLYYTCALGPVFLKVSHCEKYWYMIKCKPRKKL
jgi:hypothetical protein